MTRKWAGGMSQELELSPELIKDQLSTLSGENRLNVAAVDGAPKVITGPSGDFIGLEDPSNGRVAMTSPIFTWDSKPLPADFQGRAYISDIEGGALYISDGSRWYREGAYFGSENTIATLRLPGMAASQDTTSQATRCVKYQVNAEFSRVRFRLFRETSGAATNFTMVAAVTETAATDTADNISQPVEGGIAYPTLRTRVGAPGWVTVTVAGQSSFDWPNGGASRDPSELITDWIDLSSIPRADGGDGHLIMLRMDHNGTTDGAYSVAATSSWQTASGEEFYLEWQSGAISGGDGVADLTKTTNSIGSSAPVIAVEVDCDIKAVTVLGIGESNMEGAGNNSVGRYGNWMIQACHGASSEDRIFSFVNDGSAGDTSAQYSRRGVKSILSIRPAVVVYSAGTPNDRPLTQANGREWKSCLKAILEACKKVGAKLFVYGPLTGTYLLSEDVIRLQMRSYCQHLAAQGLIAGYIDFEWLGTGASPNRFQGQYSVDTLHVSNLAEAEMADQVAGVLERLAW